MILNFENVLAEEAGFDAYLVNPVDLEGILSALRALDGTRDRN